MSQGYQLTPDDLGARVTVLAALGDQVDGLVTSAGELAQRLPGLGTAPPALHVARRLRDAAGDAGLTGEMTAASAELTRFRHGLAATVTRYVRQDDVIAGTLDHL